MPTYSYQCETCGSEQDHRCRFVNRPDTLDCNDCGGVSRRVFRVADSQTNDPYNKVTRSSARTNGLVMHMYQCRDCDHQFEELIDFSKGEHFEDSQPCNKCGSTNSRWVPMAKIDRFSEKFPYFDRGLGVMLQSKQHRRDICKARGLTPYDRDWETILNS